VTTENENRWDKKRKLSLFEEVVNLEAEQKAKENKRDASAGSRNSFNVEEQRKNYKLSYKLANGNKGRNSANAATLEPLVQSKKRSRSPA